VLEYYRKKGIKHQMVEGERDKDKGVRSTGGEQPLYKKMIIKNLYREITKENITDDQLEELLTYISYVKNKLIPAELLDQVKTTIPSASEIYLAYEAYKRKDKDLLLVDFDDMLTSANSILHEDVELLWKYQQRYDHILVDESQDTSLVQNKIIEKLAANALSVCYVGDGDQSIYGWRGAETDYLLNFRDVYPKAVILKMENNYRSSKEIVEASNQFIKRNKDRYDMNMFTDNPAHSPVVVKDLKTNQGQAAYVASEIIKKSDKLNEVAVLYRNNSSAIPLIIELDHMNIPYYLKDSDNRFFSHWVVQDILNFMRMTYNDKKFDVFETIFNKFKNYLNRYHLDYLRNVDNNESVFDNLVNLMKLEIYQIKTLQKSKQIFKDMNTMTPLKAIQTIRKELGYEKEIAKICKRLGMKKETLTGILNILENIARNLTTHKEFSDRLRELEAKMEKAKYNKNNNAVTLSTFHSSKGLEYDSVYLVDCINGTLPTHDAIKLYKDGFRNEMEESARLFYVGMTRARKYLELLYYRNKDGEMVDESIFIKDVKTILAPKSATKATLAPKKEVVVHNTKAIYDASALKVGMPVKHAKFGNGMVMTMDATSIRIQFEKIGMKQLMLSVCLQKGILEPSKSESA
jgi:DNA helicase-2/ATP-dependent DNA helicase PcrA